MSKRPGIMAPLLGLLASPVPVAGDVPIYQVTFDVEAAGGVQYGSFMDAFSAHVNGTSGYRIEGHPVLAEQTPGITPAFWFHVLLKDTGGANQATLAVRPDNLYVSGFRNKFGEWIAFLGDERQIPRSTPLSFGGGYRDLFGDQSRRRRLPGARSDVHLKIPLAFFVLVVSEAERFRPIRTAVTQAWDDRAPQLIPLPTTKLVVN
ncbi:hypothetical protein C2845_PM13G23280 [Panicum miliaceum]|uniref:rRNA N-glycosylase n=1 Tax=Panicum miliaceum TaxID=4540 RepID=A0A3L6RG17_PANMI|nr:hypothetical protein C2845_PM13G23280 [Panicum miliaceum]